MTTLGELSRRVAELRSRLTVIESLARYTSQNYLSAEVGRVPAEMRFTTEDGGHVPEAHVVLATEALEELANTLRTELFTLESRGIQVDEDRAPEEAPEETTEEDPQEADDEDPEEAEVTPVVQQLEKRTDGKGTASKNQARAASR